VDLWTLGRSSVLLFVLLSVIRSLPLLLVAIRLIGTKDHKKVRLYIEALKVLRGSRYRLRPKARRERAATPVSTSKSP
jgi:hypothetical protein